MTSRRRVTSVALLVGMIAALMTGCGDDKAVCVADDRLDFVKLATGENPLRSLSMARDGEVLVVRVATDGTAPSVLIDVDDDRDTGMWSMQSPVSASGWNVLVDDKGGVYRHDGEPNVWSWADVAVPDDGSGWSKTDAGVRICIGPELGRTLGADKGTMRLSAIIGDASLPPTFLPGAAWPNETLVQPKEPAAPVDAESLTFAYGFQPWAVGGCATPACAADRYQQFNHVVFGSGFEEVDHPSHAGVAELIADLRARVPEREVWGYVSLVGGPVVDGRRDRIHTTAEITTRATAWGALGVTGIFLDEADLCRPGAQECPLDSNGDEITVDRAGQNAAIDAIHGLGLKVFANGYSPYDVIGEVDGVPSSLGSGDAYLLESATFAGGRRASGVDELAARARYLTARRITIERRIRLAAVDTFEGVIPDGYRNDPRWLIAREAVPAATIHGITNETYSATPGLSANVPLP